MGYEREMAEAVDNGAFLGPATQFPIYRVVVSGGQALEPEKVEAPPFWESGFTTFVAPVYIIGQVYNFYSFWDAFRYYKKRAGQ